MNHTQNEDKSDVSNKIEKVKDELKEIENRLFQNI